MQMVAMLSASKQNHTVMVERRCPSHILSCMNLTLMAECVEFQRESWTTLAHIINTPTPPGKKVRWRDVWE